MSTEETDIRIEPEDIETSEQPAEGDSFGVTAYIDIQESTVAVPEDLSRATIAVPVKDEETESAESSGEEAEGESPVEGPESEGTAEEGTEGEGTAEEGTEVEGAQEEGAEGEGSPEEGEAEEGEGGEAEEKEPEKDPEIEAIKNKIRERKREKRRKARRRRTLFWTTLTVLLISIAALIFSLSSFFTVDSIEVRGNSRFTAEEIINIAHAVPGHNIIYNPGTAEITEYLEQNPFIKSATVKRKLPSTLVIIVNERKQACAFKYDDDYLVMDDEGILLSKTRTEPKITMINGLVASRIKLGETIGTKNQQMFSKTLKLIREANAGDLYFVRIDMTEYEESKMVRAYVYDKLVVISDYDLLVENVTNGRLHKVLEKLFDDGVKRGTITLNADGTAGFEPGI